MSEKNEPVDYLDLIAQSEEEEYNSDGWAEGLFHIIHYSSLECHPGI